MPVSTSLSSLGEQVRRQDRDRFGTVLFAPADRREDLFGLYAFNGEIARIPDLVREPLLGRVRLQWWRDTLEGLRAGKRVAHPVADALGDAVARHSLSPEPFEQLLSARERDMDPAPPRTVAELIGHADATAGALGVICLEMLGVRDPSSAAAVRSVGIAWGLTGLLRAAAFHARSGKSFFPADLLGEQGIDSEAVLDGSARQGVAGVARHLAELAWAHLADGRRRRLSRAALPAVLIAPLAECYLRGLAARGFDVFDESWSAPRPRPLRLGWTMLRGRI